MELNNEWNESLDQMFLELKDPRELVKDMNYDEFSDWIEQGTAEEIECAIAAFEDVGLTEHVKVMKVYVNRMYKK